ncbi:MAG: hypothetical protein BroJett025_08000 [Patescibacteria group bacterium]|nr:MAG: hypothetical protein BroJett025_08000 [Patescibacteria group bacterium]
MIVKPNDVLSKIETERNGTQNISCIFFLNEQKEILSIHRQIFFETAQLKVSDIFIPAFYLSAKNIVLVYIKNKEKTVLPTLYEINFTKKIMTAGKFLNVQLLDHLIVTKNEYYSFHKSKVISPF